MRLSAAITIFAILLGVLPLFQFALTHSGSIQFDPYILGVLGFTLKQAFLSSLVSTTLGLFLARALNRTTFLGKSLFVNLLILPQAMPAIVVVLAIAAIFGANGIFKDWINIYGINGILFAHIFFNFPLATKLFSERLQNIPQENFRLAEQLNFSDLSLFRQLEWPALKSDLPRIFVLIFLLCTASFVIILTFGGPSSTTLEVAIYQSLRQDFDIPRALTLSTLQILVCIILVLAAGNINFRQSTASTYKSNNRISHNKTPWLDFPIVILAALIILPPIFALLLNGIFFLNFNFQALFTSIALGSCATALSLILAWPLARRQNFLSNIATLSALIVPPAVIATGWFLITHSYNSFLLSIISVIALNTLMALPFTVASLAPALNQLTKKHDQLCSQLNLTTWNRLRIIDLPMMRKPIIHAALITFVMSLGDLTAVTLLGSQDIVTLPSLIHSQMGNYRGNDAGGTALLLAALCFSISSLANKLDHQNDNN